MSCAHIIAIVSSKVCIVVSHTFSTCAGSSLIVSIVNSLHGGKPGSYKEGKKSRNRWRSWLLRLEQIRLDVERKRRRSESVEPAVFPTAWISALKGKLSSPRENGSEGQASETGVTRRTQRSQRQPAARPLGDGTHRDPERRVQRERHRRSRHLSELGCSYSARAVCLLWERRRSCGVRPHNTLTVSMWSDDSV